MSDLLAADSFRVRLNPKTGAAEARDLEGHLRRFTSTARLAWCGPHVPTPGARTRHAAVLRRMREEGCDLASFAWVEQDLSQVERLAVDSIESFVAESLPLIAEFGEGWPRLELWQSTGGLPPRLKLQLRPLPDLSTTLELRTAGHIAVDHPRRKGPNIGRYAELNRALGTEALLTDRRGYAREGATTSLVWWPHDPDAPDQRGAVVKSNKRLPSVTESIIVAAAEHRLVGTKPNRRRIGQPQPRRVTPVQLARHEVWAVNALHGIRTVTAVDGVAAPPPDASRLRWFREALDRSWQPVPATLPERPADGADTAEH
ncbi:MAG: hypothetical protein ACK5LO_06605 [Leucobacter sp.]